MPPFRHYSFDLWLTLIKSNPDFKRQRAQFFYKNFNSKNKKFEALEAIFKQVDDICNAVNEKTGNNVDAYEMYLMVIYLINDSSDIFAEINVESLYQQIEGIVFEFLPIIYDPKTAEVLDQIKQKNSSTIGLLSNTAFIKGSTLRKVLTELDIIQYFDFQLYSDEMNLSKPNKLAFELMIQLASAKHTELCRSQIVHVGDNYRADILGASAVGISTFQINSNQNNITNLLD